MRDLTDIKNWRRLGDRITTSGQPSEVQLAQIKSLGVTQMINLGPHSNDGALDDEAGAVAALDMGYTYIPVDFDAPIQADFDAFCAALQRFKRDVIHVHCIYNARVSAFFYRHAREGKGGDVSVLFDNMDSIWRPGGVWAEFIDVPHDASLPNRYEGEDYSISAG